MRPGFLKWCESNRFLSNSPVRFAVFHALTALWVLWRFWLPLPVSRRVKAAGFLFTLAVAAFPAWTALFCGGLISPELPTWILVLGNGCEFALVLLGVLTLAREAVIFTAVLAGRRGEEVHRFVQKDRRVALGMAAAAAGLSAFGIHEGIRVPDVHRMDLPIKDLPEGLEGMTLVQLSDLHASALLTEPHMAALVERVNALNPDLVLLTGDIVDGEVAARVRDVAPLGNLSARYGVFACEGNHEHYVDYEGWLAHYRTLGIRVLRNEWVGIERNGAVLTLAGTTDPWGRRFARELPDPVKAFAGAPEKGPRILLSHQPKYAKAYDKAVRFDVQLSGHTHGGQILGMDRGVAILNGTFVRGWYGLAHAKLYVHPGSGLWNGFPVRLGVPAEISCFTLRRA